MLKKIKNKKAQIPSTLTWIVAFIIIFFIMFVFTSLTLFLAKTKSSGKATQPGEKSENSLILAKQITSFLNTPISIQEEGGGGFERTLSIYELILETENEVNVGYLKNAENSKIFVREADNIFSRTIPDKTLTPGELSGKDKETWEMYVLLLGKDNPRKLTKEEIIKEFLSNIRIGIDMTDFFAAGRLSACSGIKIIDYSFSALNENLYMVLCKEKK